MNLLQIIISKFIPRPTHYDIKRIPNFYDEIIHKITVGKYKIKFNRLILEPCSDKKYVFRLSDIANCMNYADADLEGEIFQNFVQEHKYSYSNALKTYKKKAFIKGYKLSSKVFFKRYFPTEEEWSLHRKTITYHKCTFIDYERELANNKNVISDIDYGDGIYASPSWLTGNSSVGTKFMVLRTIPSEKYLVSDEEIVGDKFEVIEYGLDYETVDKKYTFLNLYDC